MVRPKGKPGAGRIGKDPDSSGKGRDGKDGRGGRRRTRAMNLVRIDPRSGKGLSLIFDDEGEERSWQLGATSIVEIFALLLRGNMRAGRRVLLSEGEVALEPPEEAGSHPHLCLSTGMVEVCAPIDRAAIKALKADLERLARK